MLRVKYLIRRAISRIGMGANYGNLKWRRIVAHPLMKGMPRISIVSQKAIDGPERLATATRLLKAYALARNDEINSKFQQPKDDLWTDLIGRELKDLLRILDSGNAGELSNYLLHFGESYTWFGGLTLSIDGFNHQGTAPSSVALSYLDKLICLGEALGVLSLENPEQRARWGENLYCDINEVLHGIESIAGISLALPNGVIPITGLKTSRGPLHYRHFNSFYTAFRAKALIRDSEAICEYGAGLGLVAYYACMLGFRDYTIFDLPIIGVFSGNFLINALAADAVCLYGEHSRTAAVNVLPYWSCTDVPSRKYALAINQDSFPEIDSSVVSEYFRQIERTTERYFLSINQEAQAPMGSRHQNSVSAMLRSFKDFHQLYRMKYWIREGYVEELYEIRH